eukprot:TRINITY_DN2872_c0_g1_i2.p1 TRINITY_DN2872_c0_g1~~TRINITY_DN2872_c0_g1_i2.p1  ORF type:complete len:297 (+),score=42.12 TRINITY_DN2872_c0_g1_i2:66-956(+)
MGNTLCAEGLEHEGCCAETSSELPWTIIQQLKSDESGDGGCTYGGDDSGSDEGSIEAAQQDPALEVATRRATFPPARAGAVAKSETKLSTATPPMLHALTAREQLPKKTCDVKPLIRKVEQVTPDANSDRMRTNDAEVHIDLPRDTPSASVSTADTSSLGSHDGIMRMPRMSPRASTSAEEGDPDSLLLWERAHSGTPTSLDQKSKMAELEHSLSAFGSAFRSLELRMDTCKPAGKEETMALKSELLDLSKRLDILMQDAMVEVCNRLPGASHIFGEASAYMDRMAQLFQLCEPSH